MIGLDSVSWKQSNIPINANTVFQWEIDYNVVIANYQQSGGRGIYSSSQMMGTDLGKSWKAVWEQNTQQLQADGDAYPGSIVIANRSGYNANLGIGMDGTPSIYQRNVNSGAQAQFTVTPLYYVGLFNNLVLGQVISTNVSVGPVPLQFAGGRTALYATASLDGDQLYLTVTGTPPADEGAQEDPASGDVLAMFSENYERVKERIQLQESFRL
jgi:rhizosphere induced protein